MASTTPFAQSENAVSTGTPSLPAVGKDLQNEKAWKEALDLCREKFSSAKADVVFQSTNPKDIRKYLEDVRQQQSKSKLSKSIRGIGTCMDALMRHEKAIDMFAQAGGMPGCVAWGCTRLVLEVCVRPLVIHVSGVYLAFDSSSSIIRLLNNFAVDARTYQGL